MFAKVTPYRPAPATEKRIRLLIEYLRTEPEGFLRTELMEVCGIPNGSSSRLFHGLRAAGLIHIADVPKRNKRGRGSQHLILPTETLLRQSPQASFEQARGHVLEKHTALGTPPPPAPQNKVPTLQVVPASQHPQHSPHPDFPTVEEVTEEGEKRWGVKPQPRAAPPQTPKAPKVPKVPKVPEPKSFQKLQRVVVIRHRAMVDYMREIGLIDETTPVFPHARPMMIEGKHVFGNLPLHLMAVAAKFTTIPLRNVPHHLNRNDLTLEQVRMYAGPPTTYVVKQVGTEF